MNDAAKPPSEMPAHRKLLDYARGHVSAADIEKFCPNDPGYGDYVNAWMPILSSGQVPTAETFDISEVIGQSYGRVPDRDPIQSFCCAAT